jgi:hypothetical protein
LPSGIVSMPTTVVSFVRPTGLGRCRMSCDLSW